MDVDGQLWVKDYNNCSDEEWKTKSLNPMPLEQYSIPLPKKTARPTQNLPNSKDKKQPAQVSDKEELLPQPKMNKINQTMFCISMQKDIHLFYVITNPQEKAKMKVKKAFCMMSFTVDERIEFVAGNNSNYIFVGSKNHLTVLEIMEMNKSKGTIQSIQKRVVKQIPELRTILTTKNRLIAISATCIQQFDINDQLREISSNKIEFVNKDEEELYRTLMLVGVVAGGGKALYYFGSKIEEQPDISKLKGAPGQTERRVQSEALTIVRMAITGDNKFEQVKAKVYPIDHIFELGNFTRSKIYEIEDETFLVSLHQEVILIKKNFERYIVWDNVSVVSSKSQSKKGQLILADKKILIYSENAEIFAHQIFFAKEDKGQKEQKQKRGKKIYKLNMPPIDNFRGNDNDEQILYDALLLKYDGNMSVLAYINPTTVIYPSNESKFRRKEADPNKAKEAPVNLDFTIICICQSDPQNKLEQLLEKGKTTQEIDAYCHRFNISKQNQTKCRWNVSDKKLKDIQNILMEIQEDKFIQTQLDNILKNSSHNLDFLSAVETKQISRLRRLLVDKVCAYTESKTQDLLKYIYMILQWLMESEMFLKKVTYSKNFLSFKQYDFIEIGKLKAASLKQEIKLLSCKKYEKRLKYFLNSFKILVISNYEEVFNFLLTNKTNSEIQEFIQQFQFIMPNFEEPSSVFISRQRNYDIYKKNNANLEPETANKRERTLSFAAGSNDQMFKIVAERSKEKEKAKEVAQEKQQKCVLWDPLDQEKEGKIPQTMEYFYEKISADIRAALKTEKSQELADKEFKSLLNNFIQSKWFDNAAFKQHSMIVKTTKEIHEEFRELKRKGAFKILVKYLYKKFNEDNISELEKRAIQQEINVMLQDFILDRVIPESFKRNVDARVLVYRNILQQKNKAGDKKTVRLELPLLEDFIVWGQAKYFYFLFDNIRNQILNSVKDIYDNIEVGFFRERLYIYLQSDLITPAVIIDFLDQFTEDVVADEIRIDVFSTIKRLLKLNDKVNSKNYINKCMDKEVLPERDDTQTGKLREQAKIPYGFFFYNFFIAFNLDYTYEELIKYTNTKAIENNKFIQQLISKYCKGQYNLSENYEGQLVCSIKFQQGDVIHEKIPAVDIHNQPLEFFGLILHLLGTLDFDVQEKDVFDLFLESYLNEGKFKELKDFMKKLKEYHVTQYNLHSNNYKLISDFKDEVNVDQQLIDYVLNWTRRKYASINGPATLEATLTSADSAISMLTTFNKNSIYVRKQRTLFDLLTSIKKFEPTLVMNVQGLKRQAQTHSSFLFLIHRFKEIGIDKFREFSKSNESLHMAVDDLLGIFTAHKLYAFEETVDSDHPEFLRFLVEVCIVMIEENVFSLATYLITDKILKANYYFKDILFLYLTVVKTAESPIRYRQIIVQSCLLPENSVNIERNIRDNIVSRLNERSFIELKPLVVQNQTDDKQQKIQYVEQKDDFFRRSLQMFDTIMSKHRKDDAFFYMVRVKRVSNQSMKFRANKYKPNVYGEESERARQNIQYSSYLLVVPYMKALELFIEKQYYPTFSFFQSKINILQDPKQRKDMIKDVNIALSKMERMKPALPQRRAYMQFLKKELEQAYDAYMDAIGEDRNISLSDTAGLGSDASKKVEIYSRRQPKDIFHEEQQQEHEYKKQLQKNFEKMHEVQEDNRINVMQKDIAQKITEIKKINQRQAMLEADIKKDNKEVSLAARKEKEIEEIRRKEKQDIESIKDTYKSNTTQRVNELIENLRKGREKANARRNAPISSIRDEPMESRMPTHFLQPQVTRGKTDFIANSPKSELMSENLLPITFKGKVNPPMLAKEDTKNDYGNKILDLQKKMFPEVPTQLHNFRKKANFDDILKLYKQSQSAEAVKNIQKYDMLKATQVRIEFVKRTYAITQHFQNFIQFLKFLISLDESWKQSIEEKSIGIATQMMKMQGKDKISIKEIAPPEFFTTVTKSSLKDFYTHSFEVFRPSLKRIFQKQLMAVHAVGILFRYSLGSENRFYNRVFQEYFKVILKNYELKNMDDKQLTLLAQKIRSNYASLPENKEQVLQELITSISNPLKRTRLLEALRRMLERKGESLVGGQANIEIGRVVQKLSK